MRLIEADKVPPIIRLILMKHPYADDIMDQVQILIDSHTIEAEAVRHGRWEFGAENYEWNCSICHNWTEDGDMDSSVLSNYCPNCGAKMDVPDINVGNKTEDEND